MSTKFSNNFKTLCCVQVLENIELNKKSLYSRVPGCQITTYYYVGYVLVLLQSTMFFLYSRNTVIFLGRVGRPRIKQVEEYASLYFNRRKRRGLQTADLVAEF
jgi:hypothetical protein